MNEDDNTFYVTCPHCSCFIEIIKINCKIFRHGVYVNTGQQINPHLPKTQCDYLVATNQIHGCGKPFELVFENNVMIAISCDYK